MQKVWTIPVSKRILNFSIKAFWDGYSSPYPVDERSLMGKYIFSLLIDRREISSIDINESDQSLSIDLSDSLAKRSPSIMKLARVTRFLDEAYHEKLLTWCWAQMDAGVNIYQATKAFIKFHNIDESEIDAAYQFVKRKKNLPFKLNRL